MNLPNKLTMARIIMIPIFLVLLLCPLGLDKQVARYIATGIFCLASITDCLDGYIARKIQSCNQILEKFMDPLADKLLVSSAMIALIGMNDAVVPLSSVVVIIIIAREFMITGFRTLAVEQNIVIAAGFWGKLKTICQMFMIIFLLLNFNNSVTIVISHILIWASLILAIVSAVDYIVNNKQVLK